MNPFYFGSSEAQLFGVHHPPEGGPARDGAVLLCPPFGAEAIAAHRPLQQLATRLARQGLHVLRFDWWGTGDSAGEGEEVTLRQWRADFVTALEELRDTSGAGRLGVVGMRLGATVAAEASAEPAARFPDLRAAVLWQPVVRGADYVAALRSAHRDWVRSTFPRPARAALRGEVPEVLGYPLPPALQEELRAADLRRLRAPPAPRVLLLENERDPGLSELQERLDETGATVELAAVSADPCWVGHGGGPIALAPVAVNQRIVEWIAEAMG